MKIYFKKYYNKVSNLPFFVDNDFKQNLILILGIVLFFVIAEDLQSELAKEKNEIGSFVAIMNDSIGNSNLDVDFELRFIPSVGLLIVNQIYYHPSNHAIDFPIGRSPPLA